MPYPLRVAQGAVTLSGVISRESLGKALRQLRLDKKLDLEDVASDASGLSRIERAEQGYSHESLGEFADALGMPVSQIYALAEEIENGTATPDTVALVHAINSLPDDSRGAVQTLVNTVVKSTAEWDGVKRRSTDRQAANRPS